MAYAKKKRRMSTKKSVKPIGFVKQGKKYKFVYGSKTKPRLGSASYSTKAALLKKARTMLKK